MHARACRLWLSLRFLHGPPGKAPRSHCLREGLTPAGWTSRAGVRLAHRDALFPASPREASRFENQFSFGCNSSLLTINAPIQNRTWSLSLVGTRGEAPTVGHTPGCHMPGLSFIYKRKKKICNKRQSRVRLGAFIPQRKDRCAHCQSLGSYDRVSAKPQPQASGGHNGRLLLRAWVSGPGYETKCVWPALGQTRAVRSFAGTLAWSSPVVLSAGSVPRPRRGQGWAVLVVVVGSPRQKLGQAHPWRKLPTS